jgi:hypothetical protein
MTTWILTNGSVLAANFAGQNLTGSSASGIVYGYMFPFVLELQFNKELGAFTSAVGVHQVGTGTVTINQTTLAVTNYGASSLPLTFNYCGSNFTLNEFALQTGTVQGTSVTLITQFHLKGITTVNGAPETVDFTMAIVSLVKA